MAVQASNKNSDPKNLHADIDHVRRVNLNEVLAGGAAGGPVGAIVGAAAGLLAPQQPADPMVALTGFTTTQVLVGLAFGGLLLYAVKS